MANYKVLQDIEAEDKLLGPLSLKQFIFAAIFIGLGFIGFTILTSGAPTFLKVPLVAVLILPMTIFGFLAAPIGGDQSNDLWLLSRLSFLFRPRIRIWSQDGISELVTITAPKRVVHQYTDGLNQGEVRSRLQALANTMDTRGWAVKNVNTNLFSQPGYLSGDDGSDRLVAASTLPQNDIASDVQASDDIMDISNNQTAQHFEQLVQESSKAHRSQAIDRMKDKKNQTQQTQDYWFMNEPQQPVDTPKDYSMFTNTAVVQPGSANAPQVKQAAEETEEEKDFAHRLAEEHKREMGHITDHMKTINPLHDRDGNLVINEPTTAPQAAADSPQNQNMPVPGASNYQQQNTSKPQQNQPNPAIIDLANNNDLNISTIARQANKPKDDDGEVVISLH